MRYGRGQMIFCMDREGDLDAQGCGTWSLRVAVVFLFVFVIFIFFAVAVVILFVFFLVRLLSEEEIGSYRPVGKV